MNSKITVEQLERIELTDTELNQLRERLQNILDKLPPHCPRLKKEALGLLRVIKLTKETRKLEAENARLKELLTRLKEDEK